METKDQIPASTAPNLTQPGQVANQSAPKKDNIFLSKYKILDSKLEKIVPSKTLRKILIITVASFITIFLLLLILGLLFSGANRKSPVDFLLNKPNITQDNPTATRVNTSIQQQLTLLRKEVNDLKFPQSNLILPVIEQKLTIEKKK